MSVIDDIIDATTRHVSQDAFVDPFPDPFDVNATALHGQGSPFGMLSPSPPPRGAEPFTLGGSMWGPGLDTFSDWGGDKPWWYDNERVMVGGEPKFGIVPKDTGGAHFDLAGWHTKHENGRIPLDAMGQIHDSDGTVGYLRPDAARSFQAMMAAAARDGVHLQYTDTYRPYAVQVECVRRKGLYSHGGLCAVPGTSPHGWGEAIDFNVNSARDLQWLNVHGNRFGWLSQKQDEGGREPWHFDFHPEGLKPGALDHGVLHTKEDASQVVIRRGRPVISSERLQALVPAAQTTSTGVLPTFQNAFPMAVAALFTDQADVVVGGRRRRTRGGGAGGPIQEPKGLSNRDANRRLAEQMAAARGWTGAQWQAIRFIVEGHGSVPGESNWDGAAKNPTLPASITAVGIPQRLLRAHPWTSDRDRRLWNSSVRYQITWFFNYIASRYGTPLAAWAYKRAHNNY